MEGQLANLAEFVRQLKNNVAQKLDATISSRATQSSLNNVKTDTSYCRNRIDQVKQETNKINGLVDTVDSIKQDTAGRAPASGGAGYLQNWQQATVNGSGIIRWITGNSNIGGVTLTIDGNVIWGGLITNSSVTITNVRFKSSFVIKAPQDGSVGYGYTLGD